MKITRGIPHQISGCYECGKEWQSCETARKQAYNHAKNTGHKCWVESGTQINYN